MRPTTKRIIEYACAGGSTQILQTLRDLAINREEFHFELTGPHLRLATFHGRKPAVEWILFALYESR